MSTVAGEQQQGGGRGDDAAMTAMKENWLICEYITAGKCTKRKSKFYGHDCAFIRDPKQCPDSKKRDAP
jgi:hypothetical protein